MHLGGQVQVVSQADQLVLALTAGSRVPETIALPMDSGAEALLGPWSFHLDALRAGLEPAFAVLSMKPRNGGEAIERTLRVGTALTLPDGSELRVLRLSGDYMSILGPAAQIRLDWGGQSETGWHFVESRDLDQRVGRSPWHVELLRLDAEPRMTVGVRRAGGIWVAALGWLVIALSLSAWLGLRRVR